VKALFGHGDGSVSGRYGAKEMLRRFGPKSLQNAIAKLEYSGLDLSRVHTGAKLQTRPGR
jgi:hypothetical protein